MLLLYAVQRLQPALPLSLGFAAVDPALAFNTAASFVTNTNWQNYSGEATMGHLTQMAGLAVQNFVSAAVGLAVAVALVRGFVRSRTDRVGNFWVDLVRAVVRVLLPMALIAAVALIAMGAIQNLSSGTDVTTLVGGQQTIPGGPVASQEAIKELGTNGGGFYNANSAHPFENPNPLSNLFEIFLLLLLPVCLTRAFGIMVGDKRQGYSILATMTVLWGVLVASVTALEVTHPGTALQAAGAAMEGKEVRFGEWASALFAVSTTGTSTGAVDSFHSSFTGVGGGLLIFNMGLGEVAPGGVGSGLYGMLVLAVMTVFVAGLMVGRTPEYLGKKLTAREIKLVSLYILTMPLIVLIGTGIAMTSESARASMLNSGPHGLSEVLYAFMSAANNNGSAFAGLSGNTDVLQHRAGPGDAARAVPAHRVRAGPGRLARRPAEGAQDRRHAADARAAVCVDAHRGRGDRRRPDLLPRSRPGSARGRPVMTTPTTAAPARMSAGVLDPKLLLTSLPDALVKLDPRVMMRNPVMFVVEVGAVFSTVSAVMHPSVFAWAVVAWLWLTVVFANLSEAVAEGRGKAQAATLRRAKTETTAYRLGPGEQLEAVPATQLRVGDRVVVTAGQVIPGDGDVVEGVASVDESAITGESAPVIRESGGDRSSVTGGTKVLSDRIVVQVTAKPGESFIDRMIALVEGATRAKTPNEIALNILLAGLTIVFLAATATLQPFAVYAGAGQSTVVLVALLVCLIPTTIGALLSAIGIAGMDRLVQHNVLAMSGRAVEAAGDVNTLLLDKTGTITLGNREAAELIPAAGVDGARVGGCGAAVQPGRRDPGGALHRRAHQTRPRAAPTRRGRAGRRALHRVQCADPNVRCQPGRAPDPQGGRLRGDEVGARATAATPPPRSARWSTPSPPAAGPPWWSPRSPTAPPTPLA